MKNLDDARRLPLEDSAATIPNVSHSETIDEFCTSERISRAMYYGMQREGWGPDVMAIGSGTRISPEAKLKWRRDREEARRRGIRRALPNNIT